MESDGKYWAHSDPACALGTAGGLWQPLAEHLQNVSELARTLAKGAAPEDRYFQELAACAGLLHDFGKYSDCFQQMIRGARRKCPHAIHGAALSVQAPIGSQQIAYAVAGHHAGLPDRTDLGPNIKANWAEAQKLLERARGDCSGIRALLDGRPISTTNRKAHADLFTRMLFSCLVDADRLDTARRANVQAPLEAERRFATLLEHIGTLSGGSETVKAARAEVLAQCLAAAETKERLLSLSVPTGGGKTLAAMALALKRASADPNYRRVIVVIPYLSIIEQNAAVYRSIFGEDSLLEHHSGNFERMRVRDRFNFVPEDTSEGVYRNPSRLPETENWDAPCIVTTSVRFFESLFSNRPSDLRRIHNIARSIIILDEVQVLPRRLLSPLLAVIEELCREWGCTFVLSTATKPAFERPAQPDPTIAAGRKDDRWNPGAAREVIADPQSLHSRLRRVRIHWRMDTPVAWPEVTAWMQERRAALCIVNTRDHAKQLYMCLRSKGKPGELFHLSTRMCPAHRLDVIASIRERLKNGMRCQVVSTQLIEAGVDVDFPAVFRAVGPLDSIIQAAGRADREGKLTEALGYPAGALTVFLPEDNKMPPAEYKEATGITRAVAALEADLQTDNLRALDRFFERYYREGDTGGEFLDWRIESRFKTISENFEMINSLQRDAFVPYGDGKELIDALHEQKFLDARLRRQLQPYSVGLQPYEFNAVQRRLNQVSGQEIWTASESSYDGEMGLQFEDEPLIV